MDFLNTEAELMQLEALLTCPLCSKRMTEPTYLVSCGHTFCNSCLSKSLSTGGKCFLCNIPAKPIDMHVDDRVAGVLGFFTSIGAILNECEFGSPAKSVSSKRRSLANDDDLFEAPLPVSNSPLSRPNRAPVLHDNADDNHDGDGDGDDGMADSQTPADEPSTRANACSKAKQSKGNDLDDDEDDNNDEMSDVTPFRPANVPARRPRTYGKRARRTMVGNRLAVLDERGASERQGSSDTEQAVQDTGQGDADAHKSMSKAESTDDLDDNSHPDPPAKRASRRSSKSQSTRSLPKQSQTRSKSTTRASRNTKTQSNTKTHSNTTATASRTSNSKTSKRKSSRAVSGSATSTNNDASDTLNVRRRKPKRQPQLADRTNAPDDKPKKKKKNVDKRNAYGESPLQVAAKTDKLDKVKTLLAQGANPNFKDNAGWSPLHEASQYGYAAIVAELLSYGGNPNLQADNNDTPLHDAVVGSHDKCVKLLMSYGGDPTLINGRSQSAYDLCASSNIQRILTTTKATAKPDKQPDVEPEANAPDTAAAVATAASVQGDPLQALAQLPSGLEVRGLAVTGVESSIKRKFHAKIRKMQAKYNDKITDKVTHLVAGVDAQGRVKRTIKYLSALIRGLWVVSDQFVDDSAAAGAWLHPEAYLVQGVRDDSASTNVPHKAVHHRLARKPGLFAGKQVLVHTKFDLHKPTDVPSRDVLVSLLTHGGAKILDEDDDDEADYQLSHSKPLGQDKPSSTIPSITASTILDAISHWQPLSSA
eukprot:TRINITY_DN11349_c1_g2_i1.p1 TRINITY_DN11349_c1_g2~~TRINITY_DN11349_c1_g2_i1.p1  ORF type:complete len:762 (+),score=166.90 TRINITY_DN11349_c1_g2_i1:73-2358(+)